MSGSDVAKLLEQISLSYQAAQRAMTSPAIVAPHEFINKRMEEIGIGQEKLTAILGGDELAATDLIVKRLAELEGKGMCTVRSAE